MVFSHIILTCMYTSGSAHSTKRKCKKIQSISVSKRNLKKKY